MNAFAPMTADKTFASKPNLDPRAEYQTRLEDRRRAVDVYLTRDGRVSAARGAVFLLGIALLFAVFSVDAIAAGAAWWLTAPAVVFLVLVVLHERVTRRLDRARAAVEYYETALSRLDDNWVGVGAGGDRYIDPVHPYSSDLDIFGHGSLFQLICRARTRLGEDTLAQWLGSPADPKTIRVRQAAIDELREHLELRERLALLDASVHDELDQKHLLHWSSEPPAGVSLLRRVAAIVLSAAAVGCLIGWMFFETRLAPLMFVLMVEIPFAYSFARQIRHVAGRVDEVGSGLEILAEVLAVLEREKFTSDYLQGIRTRLDTEGLPPSRRIAMLSKLIQRLDNSLRNQFFAPIAFLLGLPVHIVHSIEQWRTRFGLHIPDWLSAVGELEALSSMGGYAYENPDDTFPEIVASGPCFEADDVGHPVLPRSQCVKNALELGGDLRLILISGSNMSGKSTLLRTVGTNVILALAGAPVRAKLLRVSPLMVGTAMRVNDSLLEGKSYFYAALSRLKSVVDLGQGMHPLLFLFDEILQGTNSHDRRIGTEAVISKLIDTGSVGLVTTHDLALTEIVEHLGSRAINIHFEDRLDDGQMTFDYRIRPGVVKKSNALELMRLVGLHLEKRPEETD